MSDRRLEGKVVVIVGGTGGLGLAGARACVRAGASVVLVGRGAEHARAAGAEFGQFARIVQGDARDPATADQAVRCAIEAFGRLDGLYHVAGGSGRSLGDGPLAEITDAGWRETLAWNLDSLFYSNRAAVREFLARRTPGSIVNMSSVLALSPVPRYFATQAYAAAKAAVIGITRSAAAYYAPQGIRFNVLAPALVETPMSQRAAGDPEIRRYIASKQPLSDGGIGHPRDLDDAVVYFLSDGSRFTTGQVLAVDGGWMVSEGSRLQIPAVEPENGQPPPTISR